MITARERLITLLEIANEGVKYEHRYDPAFFLSLAEPLERVVRAAIAEEREAIIALVAEAYCFRCNGGEQVTAAIRARR